MERPKVFVTRVIPEGGLELVRQSCDHFIRVPAWGHVDSFNVSVAAGILMYEVRRQQGFPAT